jgi:hypothetical protein
MSDLNTIVISDKELDQAFKRGHYLYSVYWFFIATTTELTTKSWIAFFLSFPVTFRSEIHPRTAFMINRSNAVGNEI